MKRVTLLLALVLALSTAIALEAKSHKKTRPSGKIIDCAINSYGCEHFCFEQEILCSYRCSPAIGSCQESCDNAYFTCKLACDVASCGPQQY